MLESLCCHDPPKVRLCWRTFLSISKEFFCVPSVILSTSFHFSPPNVALQRPGYNLSEYCPLPQSLSTRFQQHSYSLCIAPHISSYDPTHLVKGRRWTVFIMGKPTDYGAILNVVMWFQVFISTVFIAFRIYTRYYIIRSLGWDDYMMVVNLVSWIPLITPSFSISMVPVPESLNSYSLTTTGDIRCVHSHHLGWCFIWGWEEVRRHRTSWSG